MFYPLFFKEKPQRCPGEVCDVRTKQAIQKISVTQLLILFSFLAGIILLGWFFNDQFTKHPYDLFGIFTKPK
jgi:hypothetical protein